MTKEQEYAIRFFKELRSSLRLYANTSMVRVLRITTLKNSAELLIELMGSLESDSVLYSVVSKMAAKIELAISDSSTLYNFSNEIGFLNILVGD